jgi:hypothetical protein
MTRMEDAAEVWNTDDTDDTDFIIAFGNDLTLPLKYQKESMPKA